MKPISPVRFLAVTAVLAVGLAALIAWVNWRVDPLQFYRQASYPPWFSQQARFQYPGLAKHADYDTLILGTSVSLGFDPGMLREQLSPKTLNLAMAGASAHEQSLLLRVALATGRVRRVMWDLNYEFFRGRADWVSDFDGTFPAYFYDANPWNEVPHYLLNLDATKSTLRVLSGRYPQQSLESLSAAHHRRQPSVEAVRTAFHRALTSGKSVFALHPEEFAAPLTQASFEANVLPLVQAHPEVEFDLFFPPVSAAYQALMSRTAPAAFDHEFRWKEMVARGVELWANVRLHDLQGMPAVQDFSRYTDTVHFDARTHQEVIAAIVEQRFLATPERLAETEARLRAAVRTIEWP